MKIDNTLLDKLTVQAKESSRLRMNLDLRNSDADSSFKFSSNKEGQLHI